MTAITGDMIMAAIKKLREMETEPLDPRTPTSEMRDYNTSRCYSDADYYRASDTKGG